MKNRLFLIILLFIILWFPTQGDASPVKVMKKYGGTIAIIDLKDHETLLTIGLPYNAPLANTSHKTYGAEDFLPMVKRAHASIVVNGTFFSENSKKCVMGNMVKDGKFVKFSKWEKFGTTLGIKKDNVPEMKTYEFEGRPAWENHWFSITAGPRLLKNGQPFIYPRKEGFRDPDVLGIANRNAIGFNKSGNILYIGVFPSEYTLKKLADVMKKIGCYQAMNIDGGGSQALSINSKIYFSNSRPLTNVIIVYDSKTKAKKNLKNAFKKFKKPFKIANQKNVKKNFVIPYSYPHELVSGYEPRSYYDISYPHIIPDLASQILNPASTQKLKEGDIVYYANLAFMHFSGSPVVGILNNILIFEKISSGIIFAPFAEADFNMELEARLEHDKYGIYFDALPVENDKKLKGLKLEYNKKDLILYNDIKLVKSYSLSKYDNNWHKINIELKGTGCNIYLDGKKVMTCIRPHYYDNKKAIGPNYDISPEYDRNYKGTWGIGFDGHGEFKNLKISVN